jgi:hypothetical protein
MEIRNRVGSGIRGIALLVVSITITAAIAAAMLIDTPPVPSVSASAPTNCRTKVHPMIETLEFVEAHC